MTYAFIQDVPANEEMYAEIRARLADRGPGGLIAHVVIEREAGLRYVDVWETEADWDRFRDERSSPPSTPGARSHTASPTTTRSCPSRRSRDRHLARPRRQPGEVNLKLSSMPARTAAMWAAYFGKPPL